jgi:hypothetical protein
MASLTLNRIRVTRRSPTAADTASFCCLSCTRTDVIASVKVHLGQMRRTVAYKWGIMKVRGHSHRQVTVVSESSDCRTTEVWKKMVTLAHEGGVVIRSP